MQSPAPEARFAGTGLRRFPRERNPALVSHPRPPRHRGKRLEVGTKSVKTPPGGRGQERIGLITERAWSLLNIEGTVARAGWTGYNSPNLELD
jgi:hypothetical protein